MVTWSGMRKYGLRKGGVGASDGSIDVSSVVLVKTGLCFAVLRTTEARLAGDAELARAVALGRVISNSLCDRKSAASLSIEVADGMRLTDRPQGTGRPFGLRTPPAIERARYPTQTSGKEKAPTSCNGRWCALWFRTVKSGCGMCRSKGILLLANGSSQYMTTRLSTDPFDVAYRCIQRRLRSPTTRKR